VCADEIPAFHCPSRSIARGDAHGMMEERLQGKVLHPSVQRIRVTVLDQKAVVPVHHKLSRKPMPRCNDRDSLGHGFKNHSAAWLVSGVRKEDMSLQEKRRNPSRIEIAPPSD
jgi:hypothetical protein